MYGQLMRRSRITAVAKRDSPCAGVGDVLIVRHNQDRRSEPLVQIPDQRQNVLSGLGIEISGRLICEQDRWIDGQRPGNGHALALPARQLVRNVIEAGAQLDQLEQLARACVDLLFRPTPQVQRQRHVLHRAQARQQIEELEDESDLVTANSRQVVV
jgi:hypothetical protein